MHIYKNDYYSMRLLAAIFNKFQMQPPEVFYKKSVLRNFAVFTGKHLSQSLFFKKVGPA